MWQRNFRLLWIGETISGAGSSMAGIGVPQGTARSRLHRARAALRLALEEET